MSDCRVLQPARASRLLSAGMLAALAIAAGAAPVWAQKAPASHAAAAAVTPAPAQTPAQAAASAAPLPKARTPRQIAEEIFPILQAQKTPWQLYPSYEQTFIDFADQEKALAPANNPNDPHAKRAAQLRVMAALLASMGEQAKAQEAIKHGQSTLPPEKRQSAFVEAGKEITRLLAEFARLGGALPQGGASARP